MVVEQRLPSNSPHPAESAAQEIQSAVYGGGARARLLHGGSRSDGEAISKVVSTFAGHDENLRKTLYTRWKQDFQCDMGVFVRCSATKKDFEKEFAGLPVTYYADGLAQVRLHSVVASCSPLLASLIKMASRNRKRLSTLPPPKRARGVVGGPALASIAASVASANSGAAKSVQGDAVSTLSALTRAAALTNSKKRSRDEVVSEVSSDPGMVASSAASVSSRDHLPEGTSFTVPEMEGRELPVDEGIERFSLDNSCIEGCAFVRAVHFLYTGDLRLCDVTISETLRACRFLNLPGAIDLCVEYLLRKLQPCNALSICALGNLFNCGTLEEMADEYLSDHFMEVTNDVEWRELACDAVQRLLSRDNLKCDSEASVVRALYRWASYSRSAGGSGSSTSSSAAAHSPVKADDAQYASDRGNMTDDDAENAPRGQREAKSTAAIPDGPDSPSTANHTSTATNQGQNGDEEEDEEEEDEEEDEDDEAEEEEEEEEDDDDDEEEENRVGAFASMLTNGSVRFAHLSDDEITMLTEEIMEANPALREIWLAAVEKEQAKRKRHQEKVAQTVQNDNAAHEMDDEEDAHAEVAADDDDDEDEDSTVPNLRRYNFAGGCQVEGGSCVDTLEGHDGYVYAVSEISPGILVSGSRDQTLRVWNVEERLAHADHRPAPLVLESHSERVFGLAALSNGMLASCSFDQTIRVWDPKTWKVVQTLEGHTGWVVAVAECADHLVSGAADNTVKVWSLDTWSCVKTLRGHADHVYGVCGIVDVDTKRHILASGSQDKTIKLWDPSNDWAELRTLKGHRGAIRSLKQCGRYLASASADRTIRLWMCAGKSIGKPAGKLIGHSDVVETLVSIPQGSAHPVLASASRDNSIKLWNVLTKGCIRTLVGHRNWVKSLFVMSNGKLASASADGTVRVWDLSTC